MECNDKVETLSFKVKIVNQATAKLLRPQEADSLLTINCRYPSEIKLVAPNTTLDRRSLYLTKSEPFELGIEAYDQLGRRFLNNSNL